MVSMTIYFEPLYALPIPLFQTPFLVIRICQKTRKVDFG